MRRSKTHLTRSQNIPLLIWSKPTSNHKCAPFSWEACALTPLRCECCSPLLERSLGFAQSWTSGFDPFDRHLDWCLQRWSLDAKAEHYSLSKAHWDCRLSVDAWRLVLDQTSSSPSREQPSKFAASHSPPRNYEISGFMGGCKDLTQHILHTSKKLLMIMETLTARKLPFVEDRVTLSFLRMRKQWWIVGIRR